MVVKKNGKKTMEPWSTMDHGFLRGRRRESAIRVQQNAIFRYKRIKRSCIANNHDMANAFGSVNHDLMQEEVVPALLLQQDQEYGSQRFQWATVELPGSDENVVMRIGAGNLQGDHGQ
jgi:hypothetical protein